MWSVTLLVRRSVYVTVMVALAVCGGMMAAQAAMLQDDAMARGLRIAPIGMDSESIGSGDGRIHIIPSLSAPSVKNGERLTIQAVVKAMDGVAFVTARIEKERLPRATQRRSGFQPLLSHPFDQSDQSDPTDPTDQATSLSNRPTHPFLPDFSLTGILNPPVATLTLQGAPINLGGTNASGTLGLWQTEWTAADIEEAYYRVHITVTDHTGHAYTDTSLRFSDPIAGNNMPGNTNYPNGGMRRMDALIDFETSEYSFRSAVIDAASGHAWFGTGNVPSRVVKVKLGAGANPPTRVGAVELPSDDGRLFSAVIDTANGYAYFGTDTSPGRVVKVNLGAGANPPTRIGAIELPSDDGRLFSAVIDTANGYAYFGTDTTPGRVVKVALGAGANPPTRVGAITLDSDENSLCSAVIDATNGYAWFGANTSPGHVVKIALGAVGDPPERVSAVTLDEGENSLRSAVIDAANGYAYFGTGESGVPGRVVKVALGTGANPPTRVGAVTLASGENNLLSAVIDAANGYAWFGTGTSSGRVVKVALGADVNPPTRVGAVTLNTKEDNLISAVIDALNGYAYFGTTTPSPGRVVRVALSQQGFVKGTRFTMPEDGTVQRLSFYSHASSGNLRLGLYSVGATPALLWESAVITNSAADAWLTAPIADGTPTSLDLSAGEHWLTWQVDTLASVPSYAEGDPDEGLFVPYSWNAFPAALESGTPTKPTLTTDRWSGYITYNESPLTVDPIADISLAEGASGSLTAVASGGTGEYTYQWYRYNKVGEVFVEVGDGPFGDGEYAGATTSILAFAPFTCTMAALYMVEVDDGEKVVDAKVTVNCDLEPGVPAASVLGLAALAVVLGIATTLRRRK